MGNSFKKGEREAEAWNEKQDLKRKIADLLAKVSEQAKEIERLKTISTTPEIENMIAGLKEAAIHYDEMARKLGHMVEEQQHTMTYVMLTENYPKLVSEQSQRIQQLEEALRELWTGTDEIVKLQGKATAINKVIEDRRKEIEGLVEQIMKLRGQ